MSVTAIGFVGLGAMGSRIAGRLLDGNQVVRDQPHRGQRPAG